MWSKLLIILAFLFPRPDSFQPGQQIPNIVVGANGTSSFFYSSPLTDGQFSAMQGLSFNAETPVARNELRYLRILYRDINRNAVVGELVCNSAVAEDLLYIFRKLYLAGYPMDCVRLADCFGADDIASMEANNTSCFNSRRIAGSSKLSNHSWGTAVDINPLYNPCIYRNGRIAPASAAKYADRELDTPYIISAEGLCVKLFKSRGWTWGGEWNSVKDYQHFEKKI